MSINIRKSVMSVMIIWSLFACIAVTAESQQDQCVTITLSNREYNIETSKNGDYSEVSLDGFGYTVDIGAPRLPARIFPVAIPQDCEFKLLEVVEGNPVIIDTAQEVQSRKAPKPLTDASSQAVEKHLAEYNSNHREYYEKGRIYPTSLATYLRTAGWRKYKLIDIRIVPFQYSAIDNQLAFYPDLKVNIYYQKTQKSRGTGYEIQDNSLKFEATAQRTIYNYEQAQQWYACNGPQRGLHEFVVITTTDLITAVEPLIEIEQAKGRSTNIVTVDWINSNYSGRDLAEKMRTFLREKYPTSQWGITDVCLVGHHSDVPMRTVAQDLGYGEPRTDFYFAELTAEDSSSWDSNNNNNWWDSSDNADFYSEVNVGRIPWSNWNTVNSICLKSQAFELNDDPGFKQSILFLGGFFWEDTDNAVLMEAIADQSWMTDWNQYRLYEQNSTVYSTYPCDEPLRHSNVQSAWPGGTYCFVDWAGHGSSTSAHIMGHGSEAFITSSDSTLLDDNYPAIIFADACSNSDTSATNIGAKMLQQGAVGFVGATKVALGCPGWDGPNDGSSQSLDYYFATGVTSTDHTQGEALQQGILNNYLNGGWDDNKYEIAEWTLWGNPDTGLVLAIGSDGVVSLDQPVYGPSMDLEVTLRDVDLNVNSAQVDTATVTIGTSNGNDMETVTLIETGINTSIFSSISNLSPNQPTPGNNVLEIINGELITVTYIDADNGHGGVNIEKTVTATADTLAPIIGNVTVTEVNFDHFIVEWDTDEASDSAVQYGQSSPSFWSDDINQVTHHAVIVDGLYPCTEYLFYVKSTDQAGNTSIDDNIGEYFTCETWELTVLMEANMDTNPGWTTEGEWSHGQPTGGGGQHGHSDPTSGHTGANVLGYNLSGDYPNDLPERDLITGAIDCSGAHGTILGFWRWLGVERNNYDHVYIRISTDGSNWEQVWENQDVDITDSSWIYQEFDISAFADGHPAVYIKWVMGATDGGWQYCGWNIDDVQIISSQPCNPGNTPSPTSPPTWTPAPTNTPYPTYTPAPTSTHPNTPTATPYPPTATPVEPTPTPEPSITPESSPTPTSVPETLTVRLHLNQAIYSAGDEFTLECVCFNPGYDALVDRYIILDVHGEYFFWPDWGQVVNFDSCLLTQNIENRVTVMDFHWPNGIEGQLTGVNFWGGLLWPGTSMLAADITQVTFGYE